MSLVSQHNPGRVTTILLADDHQLVREALRALLKSNPQFSVVAEASSGQAATRLAVQFKPDVILMDISMPDLNGIDATCQIQALLPQSRIIALTIYSERQMVISMLRAGAMGYLTKDCSRDDLINAIQQVMANQLYFSAFVTRQIRDEFQHPLPPGQGLQTAALPPRERTLLQLLAEGRNAKEIAGHLHLSSKTVGFHHRRLMKEFHLANMADLTKFAIREGLTSLNQ